MKRYKAILSVSVYVETNKPEDVQELAEEEIGFGRFKVEEFDCDEGVMIEAQEKEPDFDEMNDAKKEGAI